MTKKNNKNTQDFLTGRFITALPSMQDQRFEGSLIYVCGHDKTGAMGLVVNKLIDSISFRSLLDQLNLDSDEKVPQLPIHFGGPVEVGRGFVLHTSDYKDEASVKVDKNVMMTATLDILMHISEGKGPERFLIALGYAGWNEGQLENEMKNNGWLELGNDIDILFDDDIDGKREKALSLIGVDPAMLSIDAGHG